MHNGAETLDACLTALTSQDYPRERFEVIVVDDGSTDETAQIATKFSVRLISLGSNQGRIVARNTGAQAARFETLVFNDARVTPERELLAKISKREYEPLIPDVRDYDGSRWGFARFFYLLRCRLYAPYYPLSKDRGEFWITTENFDRAPKGTGCFVCSRGRWIANQPEKSDRETSDDTRILRKIVATKPILRTVAASARYQQRTGLHGRYSAHLPAGAPLRRLLSPAGGSLLCSLCRALGIHSPVAAAGRTESLVWDAPGRSVSHRPCGRCRLFKPALERHSCCGCVSARHRGCLRTRNSEVADPAAARTALSGYFQGGGAGAERDSGRR